MLVKGLTTRELQACADTTQTQTLIVWRSLPFTFYYKGRLRQDKERMTVRVGSDNKIRVYTRPRTRREVGGAAPLAFNGGGAVFEVRTWQLAAQPLLAGKTSRVKVVTTSKWP